MDKFQEIRFISAEMEVCMKTVEVIDHIATGEAARALRQKKDKSLQDVAEEMGISLQFLSDLERGRNNWTVERFEQFQKAVNKK